MIINLDFGNECLSNTYNWEDLHIDFATLGIMMTLGEGVHLISDTLEREVESAN